MTKNKFNELTKGMLNTVRIVDGAKIANVGWLNKPWMIIENEETFEDARMDNFTPIDHFRTREDLYKTHFKNK